MAKLKNKFYGYPAVFAALCVIDAGIVSAAAVFSPCAVGQCDKYVDSYVSAVLSAQSNMQELTKPVSIADYNAYIAKTAPFFSAKDRTAVINETIKRNFDTGGKFFSDPEKSASFSAALPATAASSAIAKDDAFSVAYAYLNALKPVTSYSGLPINYAAPANAEALRSVLASVRPDLDSGSTEIEDVVNFMSEHGFIGQGTAALKATEFKEYIAANKLINNMRPEVNKDPAIKKLLTKPQKLRVLLAQLRKVYPKTYAAANLTYGRLPRVNQYAVSFGYVEQDKSALSLVNGKGGANAMPTLPVTRMELAAEIPQLRIASAVPEFQAKPIPQIVITEGIGAYANTVAHTAPAVPENSSVTATADTTEKPGFFKKLFGGIFGKKETDDSSYSSDSGSSSSSSKESKYLKAKDSSSGDKTGTNFFNADSASGSSSSGASAGGGAGGGSGDVGGGSSSGGAFSGGGAVSAMGAELSKAFGKKNDSSAISPNSSLMKDLVAGHSDDAGKSATPAAGGKSSDSGFDWSNWGNSWSSSGNSGSGTGGEWKDNFMNSVVDTSLSGGDFGGFSWESPEWNNSSGAIDWSASAGNGGAGGTSASSGGDFGGFSEGLFSNDLDEAFAAEEPAQQEENDGVLDQLGFGDEQTDESPYTSSGKSSADSFFSGLASSIMGEDKSASIWNGNELDEGLSIDDEYYSNFEAAILAANIALRKDPSNVKAYLLRAKANYGLHRYDLALLDCSRAVYIDHANPAAFTLMAKALLYKGEADKAIVAASKAISINPQYTDAYVVRSMAAEKSGDFKQMLGDLKTASDMDKAKYWTQFQEAIAKYGSKAPEYLIYAEAGFKPKKHAAKSGGLMRLVLPLGLLALVAGGAAVLIRRKRKAAAAASAATAAGDIPLEPVVAEAPAEAMAEEEFVDEEMPDEVIGGHYKTVAMLGGGPSSVVYEAENEQMELGVAIKKVEGLDAPARHEAIEKIKTLIGFRHMNVAEVFNALEENDNLFIVSELVKGRTLKDRLAEEPGGMALGQVQAIFKGLCAGLDQLHSSGFVYGSLRTSDIKVMDETFVKLTGVGERLVSGGSDFGLYAAPEYASGGEPTKAGDIYALGVCLHEVLTGQPPLVENGVPAPASGVNPSVPKEIDGLIAKAMSRNPAERVKSAAEFSEILRSVQA